MGEWDYCELSVGSRLHASSILQLVIPFFFVHRLIVPDFPVFKEKKAMKKAMTEALYS